MYRSGGLPKNAYWSPQRTDDWPLMRMKIVKIDDESQRPTRPDHNLQKTRA